MVMHLQRSIQTSRGGRLWHRFRSDQRGNVVVLCGMLLPVAVATVGVAISFSSGSTTRASMQSALDAAVLAGLSESNVADPVATARHVFRSNISGFARGSASEIQATFILDATTLTGQATGQAANLFGGLVGTKTYPVSVSAKAVRNLFPVCMLGLNGRDRGSFDINGNPDFNATCAVQANSTSSSGMTQEGRALVRAKKFGVTGGSRTNAFSPPPVDGSTTVADPYAGIPFPYFDRCNVSKKGLDIKTRTTLSPGTFQPGIYVMVDGPFWVRGGGVVTGNEVMIAFTGRDSTLYLWGNSSVTLTSPKTGTYANMQFMADRDNQDTARAWVSIGGAAGNPDGIPKLTYDGVAYFPTQNFWMFGNAIINANSPTMTMVADKIWVQGSATVNVTNENRRNLQVGPAPQTSFGARLVN